MEIMAPDEYCKSWRVYFCGDEIIVDSEEEARDLLEQLAEQNYCEI